MKTYEVYDIKYDTEGQRVKGLPKKLTLKSEDPDFNPENELADMISDHTGWCVSSFKFSEINP